MSTRTLLPKIINLSQTRWINPSNKLVLSTLQHNPYFISTRPQTSSANPNPILATPYESKSDTHKNEWIHLSSSSQGDLKTFVSRHIGSYASEKEVNEMLEQIGVPSLDKLIQETVPADIIMPDWMNSDILHTIPKQSGDEAACLQTLKAIADENQIFKSYIGMGYYKSHLPDVIRRHIFEDSTWYTAYTPYQAEISQGRLESLLNFQTVITELTGMEVSNASLLDEASAASEAMIMSFRSSAKDKNTFFVSNTLHPQSIDVIKTRADLIGVKLLVGDHKQLKESEMEGVFGAIVQYPDTLGTIHDYSNFNQMLKKSGADLIVSTDILALCLLKPPSTFGADIVVGSSQRFGVPMGFGGPHAAFLATDNKNIRKIPGRIIGVSIDNYGNQAYRMTLQTREQHIRKDKATSNICTAQALLANVAAMYAVYHGHDGLKSIANKVHTMATTFKSGLNELGYVTPNGDFIFDTVLIDSSGFDNQELMNLMYEYGINIRNVNENSLCISFDETTSLNDVQELLKIFAEFKGQDFDFKSLNKLSFNQSHKNLGPFYRSEPYLQQKVFSSTKSETEMMRYMKKLEKKDLGLNTSMISLGSCTMKLNPTSSLVPILWPQFADIHPFAPNFQTQGYQKMVNDLCNYLSFITGFDGVSLQPNSGATGEFAGLVAIRKYQESIGQGHRNICLIPKSAHGTNPASAVIAGMNIKLIDADKDGKVNIAQLEDLAKQHQDSLSALMITYPSTLGVFEEHIDKICDIIHKYGGNVYMDGANMNAQLGTTSPGFIGADVCHLNLHKTFAIPHGGGGPGVGPICVKKHLIPFLMSHSVVPPNNYSNGPPVAAAPYGSAMVLPITWMFINLLGLEGLKLSGKFAILNANYMMSQLKSHYNIKYFGLNNRCAHEFILGCEEFKKTANITEEDIAKRLMDYGFHAPTMSWPVPSSLMIEPTESENKEELDRFCQTMISIREEIKNIELGVWPKDDNPLKNAPHSEQHVVCGEWNHPYSREVAAFPAPWIKERGKFWPSVSRINNAHGERNLICTCEF